MFCGVTSCGGRTFRALMPPCCPEVVDEVLDRADAHVVRGLGDQRLDHAGPKQGDFLWFGVDRHYLDFARLVGRDSRPDTLASERVDAVDAAQAGMASISSVAMLSAVARSSWSYCSGRTLILGKSA